MTDQDTRISDLKEKVAAFKKERGWGKHNNPAQLAMSISIEAAELLEHFQWGEYTTSTKDDWAEELADILIYCLNFAEGQGIDISTAIEKKLEKAAKKYPATTFNNDQNSADDYWAIKKKHRGEA